MYTFSQRQSKLVFNLHSFGGLLDELTEVSDVVWHVDNNYLVTGHLLEGTKDGKTGFSTWTMFVVRIVLMYSSQGVVGSRLVSSETFMGLYNLLASLRSSLSTVLQYMHCGCFYSAC